MKIFTFAEVGRLTMLHLSEPKNGLERGVGRREREVGEIDRDTHAVSYAKNAASECRQRMYNR